MPRDELSIHSELINTDIKATTTVNILNLREETFPVADQLYWKNNLQ